MGSSSPALSNMQFLVLLSAFAVAFASPIPEEGAEAPVALAYVHDATGDVAVDDSPAALPYVHDATGEGCCCPCCRCPRHLRRLPLPCWLPLRCCCLPHRLRQPPWQRCALRINHELLD